jgi:lipoprotein-anchoring transpeptidase ErfK/SrfK
MKYFYLLSLILFCYFGCARKKSNSEKLPKFNKIKTLKPVTNKTNAGSNCLSDSEEEKYNYKNSIIDPNNGVVLKEKPSNLFPVHSPEEIKNAIEGAFNIIPKRGSWFKSYTASKPIKIYSKPDSKSPDIGRIAPQTRLPATGYYKGPGCKKGWLRLGINAYVCMNNLHTDKRYPDLSILPKMKKGSIIPGKYAYIRIGGSPWYNSRKSVKDKKPSGQLNAGFFVHFKRFVRIDKNNYWKTIKNKYIPVNNLAGFYPSKHMGVKLGSELKLPVIFPIRKNRKGKGDQTPVWDQPGKNIVGKIKYHKGIHVYGEMKFGGRKYYRIGKCKWVASKDVAGAFPAKVPPGVYKSEHWIDINLIRQTLVAYVGTKPVFATIVSTGKGKHPTKHGVFRVYWKVAVTDMKNETGADEKYLASSVPWSLFFWRGQALHGAYWHDDFGKPKSHGCINMAPKDARYLFEWSTPLLGSGWIYVWSKRLMPGITIQIRRDDKDQPMIFGNAKEFVPVDELKNIEANYSKKIKNETKEIIDNANKKIEKEKKEKAKPKE